MFIKKTGSDTIHSGDFGESFIAYLLSREGIEVVRANTVGFDLFAIDPTGKMLPKNKLIGISVKARISKSQNKFIPSIPIGSPKIKKSMNRWRAYPYIGIVVGGRNKDFNAFVFPFKDVPKLRGKTKRNDVVAVSELYNRPTKETVKLF